MAAVACQRSADAGDRGIQSAVCHVTSCSQLIVSCSTESTFPTGCHLKSRRIIVNLLILRQLN